MLFRTNIIFLYADSLRRDLSACFIIQEELRSRGFRVFICSRRNFNYFLRAIMPSKLFVIGQIDMIYSKRIIDEAKAGALSVYFMPAEGFAYDCEYIGMYPVKYDYSFLKTVFFWGKNSLTWFKNNRSIDEPSKLIQTGYSRLPIAKAYADLIQRNEKKVGFIGRFPALNDIYSRSVMSFYVGNPKDDRYKTMARLDAESKAINCYINLFERIINETDYIISLRPHPNEDLNTYKPFIEKYGARFEINNAFDVAEWMTECKTIVGLASSSYIDACIVKVPVICLDALLGSRESTSQFDPALEWMYESCYLPESEEEVISLLSKDLAPIATPRFQGLLLDDFTGDTPVVFDNVLNSLTEVKTRKRLFDFALIKLMIFFDFILASRHYLKKNNALQFDYSYYYHKVPDNLKHISKVVSKDL